MQKIEELSDEEDVDEELITVKQYTDRQFSSNIGPQYLTTELFNKLEKDMPD